MKERIRSSYLCLVAAAAAGPLLAQQSGESSATRSFEFVYRATVSEIASNETVHIFLPVPVENELQSVEILSIKTSLDDKTFEASIERESTYGNRYWHAEIPVSDGVPIEIEAIYRVSRRGYRTEPVRQSRDLSDSERQQMSLYLNANSRVAVGHPILDPILREIDDALPSGQQGNSAAIAKGIYSWIVDNIEYKKIGTGWGDGDTFWACIERYGNCTDFHSLFISLARSKGIPAGFDMGFPVPEDRSEGNITGYHCWLNIYLPETGWFPVDASEAFNHPEKRELYYGTQPLDRIHFSTGRDLRLGSNHQDRPLNYFIYPYVEVSGVRFDGPVESSFSYREL
ncbi:MAG: transglutaminase domain-containing protein [candidate division Zixibacteria bacterium]